ncbi:hypothetical protein FQN57_003996 [Myotisia sp. PD_48]|nr:hypothetical protein FQN57_003996 [Myotisia sp. PD_48]
MATDNLRQTLQSALQRREAKGMRRSLKIIPPGAVDFSSNDFLSLATNPAFKSRYLSNLAHTSATSHLASTGSRLLDGNSRYAEELERFIASFHNAASGLLFSSGFDANAGVFACIPQPGDIIIHDELIHASVHDGMRLSRAAKRLPFEHNSVTDFERVLDSQIQEDELVRSGKRNIFVALESIYSMDGDFAPIREILDIIDARLPHRNGHVIVDEAHATGVFGPRGAGIVQQLGVEHRVFIRLHTFGKALASNGAIILCCPLTRDYLINYARPLIFTSAMGLPSLVAVRTTYEMMSEGQTEQLQSQLQQHVQALHTNLIAIQPTDKWVLEIHHSPSSPIFSLQTKSPRELAAECQAQGLMVRAIMSPTVKKGTERVRVCLHSGNTTEQIQKLTETIARWVDLKINQRPRDQAKL